MISSAVVIPEQETPVRSPSPTLKRRQSSVSSDSNKRPRLDTQLSNNTSRDDYPSPKSAMSPPRRKSALGVGAAEEKKRGQRLFGALLGNLAQPASKPAHRKRDEIEARQRERAKRANEEREAEARRKRLELDRIRRDEQKAWDEQSMRIRHRNMRATANFLQTKTEPRLYYKPWDMRDEEVKRVEQQVKATEAAIQSELAENSLGDSMSLDGKTDERAEHANGEVFEKTQRADIEMSDDRAQGSHRRSDPGEEKVPSERSRDQGEDKADDRKVVKSEEEQSKEDDHGGEELVEGREDDVIY